MTPHETYTEYRQQVYRRLKILLISFAAGLLASLIFALATGTGFGSYRIGLLIHGVIFWPWFIKHVNSKSHISTREGLQAKKSIEGW